MSLCNGKEVHAGWGSHAQPAGGVGGRGQERALSADGATHLVLIKHLQHHGLRLAVFRPLEQVWTTGPSEQRARRDEEGTEEGRREAGWGTAFLRPLLSGRDKAGHREQRGAPCPVGGSGPVHRPLSRAVTSARSRDTEPEADRRVVTATYATQPCNSSLI